MRRAALVALAATLTLCSLAVSSLALAATTTAVPVTTTTLSSSTPTTSPTSTTTTVHATGETITTLPTSSGAVGSSATAISCVRPSYCAAGGVEFQRANIERPVLSVEANGTWAKPQIITGATSGASSAIVHVVCPRVGGCVALGQLISTGSSARFSSYLVVQHGSQWAPAHMIPSAGLGPKPSCLLTAMTCVTAVSCVLTGTLVKHSLDRVFSLTWRNGHWGVPHFLSGSTLGAASRLMTLSALSCVGS
ncbi:MAG: hypothetical protein HKL85_00310 [Acidimicrobiaceae bacterium]|nr:hypothetical protein [Acidimicrobiaceae bacterium]